MTNVQANMLTWKLMDRDFFAHISATSGERRYTAIVTAYLSSVRLRDLACQSKVAVTHERQVITGAICCTIPKLDQHFEGGGCFYQHYIRIQNIPVANRIEANFPKPLEKPPRTTTTKIKSTFSD